MTNTGLDPSWAIRVPRTQSQRPSAGFINLKLLIPELRIAVISLSSDSLPYAINVEIKTAIGTARASTHAKFKKTYSNSRLVSIPLPKNLSIVLKRKLANKIKIKTINAMVKGKRCSRKIYLDSFFTDTI